VSSFCLGCGKSLTEGEQFCSNCGRDASASPAAPKIDPSIAFGLPPENSGKAIFSLICGILFIILPFSIVAVIFGCLSLSDIRRSGGRLTGRGLAITGIVLGYVGVTLLVGLIGLGIYTEITTQRRAKYASSARTVTLGNGNEVVTSIRTLNMAEIAYSQAHRSIGYTCSLSELSRVWGIDRELALGRKNGYSFRLQCTAAGAGGPVIRYHITAAPIDSSSRAMPAYCSDESDVIRVARSGSPDDCVKSGVDFVETDSEGRQTSAP
jgi:hypothetical protein